MGQKELFRKSALDKLASPERLDQLIRITSPLGWITLWALIFLVLIAVIWGFAGSIPTTANASGILTRTGGIYSIQSPATGIIMSINVREGDVVKAGEVVARLSQVDLLNSIKRKKQQLRDLKTDLRKKRVFSDRDLGNKVKYYDQMVHNLEVSVKNIKSRLEWLHEQLKNKKELYRKGLITKDRYLAARKDVDSANLQLKEQKNEIKRVLNNKFELSKTTELDEIGRRSNLRATQLELQLLEIDLVLNSQVFSPYEGRVMDINFKEGNYISKGVSLFTIEKRGKSISNLKTVLYIRAFEAKNVKVGMKVHICPAHVKQEEYGYMVGLITFAGQYPTTSNSMMKELENKSFVQSLSSMGVLYKFEATIIPDPGSYNGYMWSTARGYPFEINSGTICSGKVVVKEQIPASFVVPIFNKYILGEGSE